MGVSATLENSMSMKNYKKGLRPTQDQAVENSRHIFANTFPGRTKGLVNPWWNRRRHTGWAAYHRNKTKDGQSEHS
jgi:hypothetical protein